MFIMNIIGNPSPRNEKIEVLLGGTVHASIDMSSKAITTILEMKIATLSAIVVILKKLLIFASIE